jgi:zinc protease
VTTSRKNLPEVVALVGEILRQPTFPAEQFDELKKDRLESLEGVLPNPMVRALVSARLAARRHLSRFPPDDVCHEPTTKELIERASAVELSDVVGFYRDFYGMANASIAVVGDFQPREVQSLLEAELTGWRAPKPLARVECPFQTTSAANEEIEMAGESAAIYLGAQVEMRDDDSDYPAMLVWNFALGGLGAGVPSGRLANARHGEWSFPQHLAASTFEANSRDRRAIFTLYATCAAQDLPRAMADAVDELKRIQTGGISVDELEQAKKAYLEDQDILLADDRFVVRELAFDLGLDRTFDYNRKLNAAIANLTIEDMNRVIGKHYIDPDRLVRVSAGDLKRAAAGSRPASSPP